MTEQLPYYKSNLETYPNNAGKDAVMLSVAEGVSFLPS